MVTPKKCSCCVECHTAGSKSLQACISALCRSIQLGVVGFPQGLSTGNIKIAIKGSGNVKNWQNVMNFFIFNQS